MQRVMIAHEEMGLYVGSFLGLGLWSKLDIGDQPSLATFIDNADAKSYIETWEEGNDPTSYTYLTVEPDDGTYISIEKCKQLGLEKYL